MNRQNRGPDGLRVDSAAGTYTPERASMSPSFSLASVPASVSPEPAYIAPAAAANVIAGEVAHEFHVELSDGASVSPASLHLINTFLDRLLFNFLSSAHSTSLGALRPAVTEVLRPRLAKEAIAGADEELEEYLGGDSEEMDLINGEKPVGPWDLDVAWKRTRLRCMLYTRLGDMEEEEEEMFLEQDNLQEGLQPGSYIQPAVAIFLTSVLEFIGEHALMIAAQAAYKRHEIKARIESLGLRKITVEEVDMEKNAVNSTLGRLWRSWRASIRSPRGSLSRMHGVGPRGFRGFSVSSRSSMTTESHVLEEPEKVPSVEEILEGPDPSTIALPTTIYDIDEIEVPGFSSEYAQRSRKSHDRFRAESMFVRPGTFVHNEDVRENDESTENDTEEDDSSSSFDSATPTVPYNSRARASSLPNPQIPSFVHTSTPSENSFSTPLEEAPRSEEIPAAANPIIDVAGNSVAVIEDYAIPKSSSAPGSPFGGSMLNAISATAASGLAGRSFYHEDDEEQDHDHDPAEGALQFDRNDYEVGEHEHSNLGSRVSTVEPMKNLQPPFELSATSAAAVSPLVGPADTSPSGAVSPLEPEFARTEVSPLDETDDDQEDGGYSYVSRKGDTFKKPTSPITPATTDSIASITSPIIATTAAAAATVGVVGGTVAAGILHERKTDAVEHSPAEPVVIPRANQGRQRSREGPTSQDYAKEDNRETYVLPQELNIPQQPEETPRSLPDTDSRRWRPSEKGVINTSLPPVRESLENPAISPISPEQSSPTRQHPVSRKAVPPSNPIPTISQKRQISRIATDVDPQITGQRLVTSPVSAKDLTPTSRTSDASFKAVNPTKASLAKSKGRVESLSSDHRDSFPSRSSSEGHKSTNHDRFSRSSTSNSDSHRDFDQLINSGETVKYTLTSQNMREIEERGKEPGQKAPASIQRRTRASSNDQNKPIPSPTTQTPSPQSMNGLRSNPTGELPMAPFVVHAGLPVKRGPHLIAKDARMERTNTSELKDFFRSTGPEGGAPNKSPVNARFSGSIPQSPRVTSKAEKLMGHEGGQRQPNTISPSISSRTGSMRSKPKFEPREATRSQDDTAMLAEFFRQGPPGAQRTPTKLGIDDSRGRFRDAPSVASTQDSFVTKSVQSSTNSRVGLLDSTRAYNNSVKTSSPRDKRGLQNMDEPAAPVRKQRRVRDPYAIDTDSEDEDDDTGTPRAGRGQENEESLIDFLRNAEPPSEQSITPPPIRFNGQSKETNRKSGGGGALKSRFGSTSKKNAARGDTNNQRVVSTPASISQNYNSATTSNYPTFQGNSYASMRQPQTSQPSRSYTTDDFNAASPRMNGNGVRQARKLARDGREDSASVRDLADFLRNTEPPPSTSNQPPLPPIPAREDAGGFTRMFSRRKKAVIA